MCRLQSPGSPQLRPSGFLLAPPEPPKPPGAAALSALSEPQAQPRNTTLPQWLRGLAGGLGGEKAPVENVGAAPAGCGLLWLPVGNEGYWEQLPVLLGLSGSHQWAQLLL